MPLPQSQKTATYLDIAVFRLLDTCVNLQEDMGGYIRTASLEAVPGIVSVFRWLMKRDVRVILYSELSPSDTELIMERLGWKSGPKELITDIRYPTESGNPIQAMVNDLGLASGRHLVTLGDTAEFLNWSWAAGVKLNIGATYGSTSFRELGNHPHHTLLDNVLGLPDYLVSTVIVQEPLPIVSRSPVMGVSRMQQLRLRLPFF
ncbi:hypothetical protein CEQ90_00870 [Lewinellaceae bacterium SD302]|nr:hypothetical protein CEQ90_00870 [Lewinellaceae bacterium SD302]